METLQTLGKRIATTEELRAIVRTMKTLSAVSIHQYERAAGALDEYSRTVELGLRIVLRGGHRPIPETEATEGLTVAVVFGSDHGLCGRFNREIAEFARQRLQAEGVGAGEIVYLAVGARAFSELEALEVRPTRGFGLPGSVDGLTDTAEDILLEIDRQRTGAKIGRIVLFHNHRLDMVASVPHAVQLLPLAADWLRELAEAPWPSRTIPCFTMNGEALFAGLVRQHLFVELYRAGVDSAASEHAMRLSAMEAAERNIEDKLGEMNADYRRKRQESITEEMLDVIAGFEALTVAPQQDRQR